MTIDPEALRIIGMLVNSDDAKALLGPTLRVIGDIARFYSVENLKKIFTKWGINREKEESRQQGEVLEAIEFERILPLLPDASLQSDDELQDRWAALLESAASADPNYLPGFGKTLAQISADEARFLDRIWNFLIQLSAISSKYPQGMEPVSESRLVYVYDPNLFSHLGERGPALVEQVSPGQLPDTESVSRARLFVNDFLRLGILGEVQTLDQERGRTVNDAFRRVPPSSINQALASIPPPARSHLRIQYALTRYGVSFIQAVAAKKSPAEPTRT
jgi:hypothetical protein